MRSCTPSQVPTLPAFSRHAALRLSLDPGARRSKKPLRKATGMLTADQTFANVGTDAILFSRATTVLAAAFSDIDRAGLIPDGAACAENLKQF